MSVRSARHKGAGRPIIIFPMTAIAMGKPPDQNHLQLTTISLSSTIWIDPTAAHQIPVIQHGNPREI